MDIGRGIDDNFLWSSILVDIKKPTNIFWLQIFAIRWNVSEKFKELMEFYSKFSSMSSPLNLISNLTPSLMAKSRYELSKWKNIFASFPSSHCVKKCQWHWTKLWWKLCLACECEKFLYKLKKYFFMSYDIKQIEWRWWTFFLDDFEDRRGLSEI